MHFVATYRSIFEPCLLNSVREAICVLAGTSWVTVHCTIVTSLMIWILNLHMNTMLFCQLLWTQECVLVKSRGNLLKEEKNIKWSISKPNAFKSWQIFQKNFVGTQKQLHKFKQHVTIIYLQTIKNVLYLIINPVVLSKIYKKLC